jgi:Caspase domain
VTTDDFETLPAPPLPTVGRYALVIGNSDYADPSLSQLRSPTQDTAGLAAVLADSALGGFRVTTLLNRTAHEIRLAADEFLADREPDDLVLIYLSCHGLVDARQRLYFIASDTVKARLAATGIEADWLVKRLDDSGSRRQVMILDCCFSGAWARGRKGDEDFGVLDRFKEQGRGRAVVTASGSWEYSLEGEPVDGVTLVGSIFTTELIEGVRSGQADTDRDGYISVDEAFHYASDKLRARKTAQTPQIWLDGVEGKLLLSRSPIGFPVQVTPIPETLRVGLESSYPDIRIAAMRILGRWLSAAEPGRVLAAQRTLRAIAEDDGPRVVTIARALLSGGDLEPNATNLQILAETEAVAVRVRADAQRDVDAAMAARDQLTAERERLEDEIARIRYEAKAEAERGRNEAQAETERVRQEAGADIARMKRAAESEAAAILAEARRVAAEDPDDIKAAALQQRAEAAVAMAGAERNAAAIRTAAEREAAEVRVQARREADKLRADRDTQLQRTTTADETAETKAVGARDIASLRATAEREITQLRAKAARDAEEKRAAATTLLADARGMRDKELKALEIEVAEHREKAQRDDETRHAAAVAATQRLITEADLRARTAEERAKLIEVRAEARRVESERSAIETIGKAKEFGDKSVTEARAEASRLVSDARAEADRTTESARREVEQLDRQKAAIFAQLELLSASIGNIPGHDPNRTTDA